MIFMYLLTRVSARIGCGDGIHIFGIQSMPCFPSPVRHTLVKTSISLKEKITGVVRVCPAVLLQVPVLITGPEGIVLTPIGPGSRSGRH